MPEELAGILSREFAPWPHLTARQQKEMAAATREVLYKKGEAVYSGESDCAGVVLLLSGALRTYMVSEEGREITLFRQSGGDVCILASSCVLPAITFDVRIDAEEDSRALVIGAVFFAGLMKANIHVECYAYRLGTERFSEVMWAMQQILFMSFDRRLAIFLWDELSKTGSDTLRMTHDQVARYMGSAREVVTRMLRYFTQEGIVELSRGEIRILDKKKLLALTGA
jgi:CRP/FNR family transcriptional regulator